MMFALLMFCLGCLPLATLATEPDRPHHSPLISTKQLMDEMRSKKEDLLIVDVRTLEQYRTEHIPGAINLPAELSFDSRGDKTRVATLNNFRKLLSRLGVRNSDYVVLYGGAKLLNAAHVFWAMEVYGHARVSVLEGGLPGWINANGKLSTKFESRSPSTYIPSISAHLLATKFTARLAIDNPGVIILDSRKKEEYHGKKSTAKRAGHIPKAISIPAELNLEPNGRISRLKSKAKLQSLYKVLGKNKQVVTYCNRGRDSAVSYLVLRSLGYRVSIYDGAWPEWGNDYSLPITNPSRKLYKPGQ